MVGGEKTTIKMSDFRGKWTILFFYPLDFTFVCPVSRVAASGRAAVRQPGLLLSAVHGFGREWRVDLAWCKLPPCHPSHQTEIIAFNDRHKEFEKHNCQLIAASCDSAVRAPLSRARAPAASIASKPDPPT